MRPAESRSRRKENPIAELVVGEVNWTDLPRQKARGDWVRERCLREEAQEQAEHLYDLRYLWWR